MAVWTNGDQVEGYNRSLFKIRADLSEVTVVSFVTSTKMEGRDEREKEKERKRRSRNRKNIVRWKRVWCNYYEAGYPRTRNERPTTPSLMRVRARQDFESTWQGRLLYTMHPRHKDQPRYWHFLITPCLRGRDSDRQRHASIVQLSPTISFAWYEHVLLGIGNQKFSQ